MTTYPYEYTKKVYTGLPFTVKIRKDRYWDSTETYIYNGTPILTQMWAYNGLTMSYLQLSTSLMTVSIASGQLPNNSYCTSTLGCLATVGQGTKYTNFTKVGTPTVNEMTGVATGFSGSNYLTLGVNTPDSGTWEIVVKFTTGTSNSGASVILGTAGTSMLPFYKDGNYLYDFLSTNGTSWNVASADRIMSISTNTTYKMKAEFTGSAYNWYNWENGDWVLKRTFSYSSPVKGGNLFKIGSDFSNTGASVDLSETYIKVNGVMYWTPATTGDYYKVLKNGYINYTTYGTPTINTDTGIVSGFSTSNYIYKDFGLSSANSWEINTAFSVTSNTSSKRNILCSMAGTGGVYAGVSFDITSNNYLDMQLGLTTSSYDNITGSFAITPNTKYYLKGTFDGSTYEFKYSTDGETYTSIGTISSTAKIYQSVVTRLGIYGNGNSEPLTNGTIYLADTNIYVDGSEYWTPKAATSAYAVGLLPSGVVDDGSAQTWNLFYNNGTYLLNTTSTMTGYTWVGSVAIPAHTV